MKKSILCILLFPFLFNCKSESKKKDTTEGVLLEVQEKEDTQTPNNVTAKKDSVITDFNIDKIKTFLEFYQKDYDDINSYDMLDLTKGYYRINFKAVKAYTEKLNEHKDFEGIFIENFFNHIKEVDSNFQVILQEDGPPEGLTSDYILKTQDIDEILDIIKNKEYSIKSYRGIKGTYLLNMNDLHCLLFYLKESKITDIRLCE